ncbi:low-specificity L-threonine aldolase [Dictyobacter formicarum]|uniref:Threonine aldolase n=1 Tax=Dictyobacter formicarum TaxID=2778368 RepID=A0ABQ3VHZ3_9CHLR|nr:low-specificity L-threonine aldolase [Dictyobacter formicarum]GHO84993.1 threonine aldolase [Dictyobacter formicarum]
MYIDLRSDTVTQPTAAMREAMYQAEVGDDVYSEDPTINRLQELAATITGKEAALFVPSGTMGNAIALLTHAGRGQAVIVGDQSHIYRYEAGGASTLGGSPMYTVPTHPDGMLDLDAVTHGIADESDEHTAATALICIENSHNRCGGTVIGVEQIEAISALAHTHGVAVHMDGARIFNAATALNIPVSTLVSSVDSLMFCLSKGLSAPVGSLLVGETAFIRRARRVRKVLGGGMRQAGVLAAAGIVALEQMVERLAEDHENCERLAYGLADIPHIQIQPDQVVTNILLFSLHHGEQPFSDSEIALFLNKAREQGILLGRMGERNIRAVTHAGIEAAHIDQALIGIRQAIQEIYPS